MTGHRVSLLGEADTKGQPLQTNKQNYVQLFHLISAARLFVSFFFPPPPVAVVVVVYLPL